MSTFKRLLNLGKGKTRQTRNKATEVVDAVRDGVSGGEWVEGARHKAADAAEALAEAIRPEDRVSVVEDSVEDAAEVVPDDAPEVDADREVTDPDPPSKPRKRRL